MPSAKCTLLKSAVPRRSAKLPARTRAALASIRTVGCGLAIAAGVLAGMPVHAQESHAPDAALQRLLREARAAMPEACTQPGIDRLVRILCSGRIRIGVRDHYPLFSTRSGETRQGFEIDIAQAVAGKLGIAVEFARVNAANRIPMIADDKDDLAIATMGHNTLRDGQVRLIRPHYYRSETIVVGQRGL